MSASFPGFFLLDVFFFTKVHAVLGHFSFFFTNSSRNMALAKDNTVTKINKTDNLISKSKQRNHPTAET